MTNDKPLCKHTKEIFYLHIICTIETDDSPLNDLTKRCDVLSLMKEYYMEKLEIIDQSFKQKVDTLSVLHF